MNQLVIYYTNGDAGSAPRYFNIKVNGGGAQNKAFAIVEPGNWNKVAQAMVTLSGFTAGNTNTVQFMGDGNHGAPDLDWIEVIAAPPAAPRGCVAGRTVALKSLANARYASNRAEDSNNVKAQALSIGSWEQFDVIDVGSGQVALKSQQNNMYMTADISWSTAPIGARAASIGAWEKFRFELLPDGYYALRAMVNGKLVSTRISLTNAPLQAVATTPSTWEEFQCD